MTWRLLKRLAWWWFQYAKGKARARVLDAVRSIDPEYRRRRRMVRAFYRKFDQIKLDD
jgi:hypothetical protein